MDDEEIEYQDEVNDLQHNSIQRTQSLQNFNAKHEVRDSKQSNNVISSEIRTSEEDIQGFSYDQVDTPLKVIGKKDNKLTNDNNKNSIIHDNSVQKIDQYKNESFQNTSNINDENEEGDQIIFANKVQNEVENCDLFTNSEESE